MKRLFSLLFSTILVLSLMSPIYVSADGSDGSWCTVTIDQSKVGHPSGCTVCSLQLMFQNSQTIDKEYQLSGSCTSNTGKYKKFNDLCESSGTFQQGDSWVIGSTVAFSDKYCSKTFSEASIGSDMTQKDHFGNKSTIVGMGGKDFRDMSKEEQIDAMKVIWNNGYYAIFCVDYEGVDRNSNGPDGYLAAHATMFAGVDDKAIYINDPATGRVDNYFNSKGQGGSYQLLYMILFKNSKTSPKDLSGGATIDTASGNNEDNSLGIPAQVYAGYCSEQELASWCTIKEMNIQSLYLDGAMRDNLSSKETGVLSDWELNVDMGEESNGLISFLRQMVQLFGIVFTVWMIFIYIAYWLDRLNTFFDIDFLGILTFKKLVISPTEEECNFSVTNKGGDTRTVNHKTLLKLCITGIAFGCLIVSGFFYKVLSYIIFRITQFLN